MLKNLAYSWDKKLVTSLSTEPKKVDSTMHKNLPELFRFTVFYGQPQPN